jgi:hypothetical protein
MTAETIPYCRYAARLLAVVAGTGMICIPMPAAAEDTFPATANMRTVIVKPMIFFKVQDLSFGDIIPGTTASTVLLRPDGVRTKTGSVVLAGASQNPALFAGMGVYNERVRIRVTSNTIQLRGPGAPMMVSQFEIGSTPVRLTTNYQVFYLGSSTGIFNFPVGALLAVNANQKPGMYTGTFSVTLEYD